jgi:hypothetical protein
LVFAQALAVMQKKISDLSQGANALRGRAVSDGLLKFGDDGDWLLHKLLYPMPPLASQMPRTLKSSTSNAVPGPSGMNSRFGDLSK